MDSNKDNLREKALLGCMEVIKHRLHIKVEKKQKSKNHINNHSMGEMVKRYFRYSE